MIFIDSEGEPIQEFSAIYVRDNVIVDVFHQYVKYPFLKTLDEDHFARSHIHGLDIDFLEQYGLDNTDVLYSFFSSWLKKHSVTHLFAHAPSKEKNFLQLPIQDVHLKPWRERHVLSSHRNSFFMKMTSIPICNVSCNAHTAFHGWYPKRKANKLNATDIVKTEFGHHCSLYDCVECFLFMKES